MGAPLRFGGNFGSDSVCILKKALDGLKQSLRHGLGDLLKLC